MPDAKHHEQNRNWFETILHYIPGLSGLFAKGEPPRKRRIAAELAGRAAAIEQARPERLRPRFDGGGQPGRAFARRARCGSGWTS